MERYFKISESELIELLSSTIQLSHLEMAGVDNWNDGGMTYEFFKEACKEAGFPEDPDNGYYDYSYQNLAKDLLSDYQEVKQ